MGVQPHAQQRIGLAGAGFQSRKKAHANLQQLGEGEDTKL
jgi:hypothetical protein